jgi:hypothetical protein
MNLKVNGLTLNPAVVLYIVNAVIALAVAWGVHLSTDVTGAIDTIVTGGLTVIAAFLVRPVAVSAVIAALATIATAFSAFGLHLSQDKITATAAVVSLGLGALLHALGIPVVAAARGKTGTQLYLEPYRVEAPPRGERFVP